VSTTLLRVDALFGPATALPSHASEQRALPSDGKTVEFSGG
jgi:hypothetical protein